MIYVHVSIFQTVHEYIRVQILRVVLDIFLKDFSYTHLLLERQHHDQLVLLRWESLIGCWDSIQKELLQTVLQFLKVLVLVLRFRRDFQSESVAVVLLQVGRRIEYDVLAILHYAYLIRKQISFLYVLRCY